MTKDDRVRPSTRLLGERPDLVFAMPGGTHQQVLRRRLTPFFQIRSTGYQRPAKRLYWGAKAAVWARFDPNGTLDMR